MGNQPRYPTKTLLILIMVVFLAILACWLAPTNTAESVAALIAAIGGVAVALVTANRPPRP